MTFPSRRPRRLRRTAPLRELVAETSLNVADLVAPLFVREDIDKPNPILSLPGVVQHTLASLHEEVKRLVDLGIPAVMLFGIPATKDAEGSQAWHAEGIAQVALRNLQASFGDKIVLMVDLCLDEYTDHGHCGIVNSNGEVENDATVELYAATAVAQAAAGASVVAPSGMMDGQVAAIRSALDKEDFSDVSILAYSAKYASSFYGPFREAVNVTITHGGDRKGYQQDYRNKTEAVAETLLDIDEGADMVMVKPALAYLDIIAAVKPQITVPLAAYQVSGEYAMIKAAAANGWVDGDAVMLETLVAIKRAGADFILSYFAADAAERFLTN